MNQALTIYWDKFEAITDKLLTLAGSAKKLYIYPHISADGDALGSSLGLALLLAQLDIQAQVLASEAISDKLSYLPYEGIFQVHDGTMQQEQRILYEQVISLAIDCSSGDRLDMRVDLYHAAETQMVIDHHISDLEDDPYYLLHTTAAATCEIVTYYALYLEERFDRQFLTQDIGIALMTGLVTDTGRFSFSSTTSRTFEAASNLMRLQLPMGELTERLFDTISTAKLRLTGVTATIAKFYYDNRFAMAELTRETLSKVSWVDTDLEGLPSLLRNVDGVEVSVLLRQLKNGDIRGNVRTGANVDAQAFARHFGGGGHLRAAGFTINDMSMEDAKKIVIKLAGEILSTSKTTAEL